MNIIMPYMVINIQNMHVPHILSDSVGGSVGWFSTSGYPWSNPIRLNNFSYELSLIGIFLDGLPGTIVLP